MLTSGFIHDDNIINTDTVPQYLCYECRKLNTATIDDTAVKIGNWAFSSCFTLNELYFGKNLKNIGNQEQEEFCKIDFFIKFPAWHATQGMFFIISKFSALI